MKTIINLMRHGLWVSLAVLTGCATIVNDPMIPLAVNFSDGSSGSCEFTNKRGKWESEIPTDNVMIRRSDDALNYDCDLEDGREVSGSIRSEVEGEKVVASVLFWDLGITDAITDKHRTYQAIVAINVPPGTAVPAAAETPVSVDKTADVYAALEKLNELKEKGIITQDEFDAEKMRLLNR